ALSIVRLRACGGEVPVGSVVPILEFFVRDLLGNFARPARGEYLVFRFDSYACIDQRTATETVRHENADVLADADIEQPAGGSAGNRIVEAAEAYMSGQVGCVVGKGAGHVFASALEHADGQRTTILVLQSGEARGRDASAVTAAHDQNVVGIPRFRSLCPL